MKSILVIGLGRFGRHLALKFAELRDEVMVVDNDEARVNDLAPLVTSAQIGDCTDERVLETLGVRNFDICFVCIGSHFQSSLEVTSLLKEMGAARVIAKADRDIHAKFLLRNGADEVIYPEKEVANRTAIRHSAGHAFDYIEWAEDYCIAEVQPLKGWLGKSIREVAVRTEYKVGIIAIKGRNGFSQTPDAGYVFTEIDHLIISGGKKDVVKLLNRT
jgi:trk system potassium uptake protein TrkA